MLKGKTALITGANRGIGKGIATKYVENGAGIMIVYRSEQESEEAQATAEELRALAKEKFGDGEDCPQIEIFEADVTDADAVKAACNETKKIFGGIDILVNNAGITNDKLMLKMKPEDFGKVVEVNLQGSFNFLKFAGAIMIKQRQGSIINMSSISGIMGNPAQINYSASKAGVIGMTKSAAKELGRRGIRVNAIAPGFIDTDMTAVLTDEQKAEAAKNISMGRTGKPEDIAGVALFLASDLSAYVTGQVIGVDGGLII